MQKEVYEFISKQTNDPIVEWKTCAVSGEPFAIFQSDLDFYDKISPVLNGTRYQIPTPTLCPEERQRRRLFFRNERKLYRRKCDATGRDIISLYSPDKPHKVFEQKFRWSDAWDAMNYGRDYDAKVSMFEQIKSLIAMVPKTSLNITNSENCEFCTNISNAKNCYLSFGCSWSTDVYYTNSSMNGNLLVDCDSCADTTIAYQCIGCKNCFKVFYSKGLKNCTDMYYCANMQWCNFCFMSSNLVNQEYCIRNKQYIKEEYEIQITNLLKEHTHQELIAEYADMTDKMIISSEVIFPVSKEGESEDENQVSKYIGSNGGNISMSYDADYLWTNWTRCYESLGGGIYEIMFSTTSSQSNLFYCDSCHGCKNCFACAGLRQKEYCILNKQYTKAAYQSKVAEIIEDMIRDDQWGEFFDPSLSTFCYNESNANDAFPLTREEAMEIWYAWQENAYDATLPQWIQILKGNEIPIDPAEFTDDLLQKIFICEVSNRPYRLIKQELSFYRTYGLPLPRKHPDVRYEERLAQKTKKHVYIRSCDSCSKEMIVMWNEKHQGKIYCKSCYEKEMNA